MSDKEKLQGLLAITSLISQYCYELSKSNVELANSFALFAIGSLGIAASLEELGVGYNFSDLEVCDDTLRLKAR